MKIAIMQPYFFPYIGYFQLMNAVDKFVVYDNIQYTKKGWINRNRILVNGTDEYITVPLKKDSDYLDVRDRYLADTWDNYRGNLINKISGCYRKAPYFTEAFKIVEQCLIFEDLNLFRFVFNSLMKVKEYLNIKTSLSVSSSIPINHELKGEEKVIAICVNQSAETYINPIGGMELYSREAFKDQGINLQFLKANPITYPQFDGFVPWLSIVDVLMFNSREEINLHLKNFNLEP